MTTDTIDFGRLAELAEDSGMIVHLYVAGEKYVELGKNLQSTDDGAWGATWREAVEALAAGGVESVRYICQQYLAELDQEATP